MAQMGRVDYTDRLSSLSEITGTFDDTINLNHTIDTSFITDIWVFYIRRHIPKRKIDLF